MPTVRFIVSLLAMSSDAIIIKTDEQISGIRTACKLVALILDSLEGKIIPGITTGEIDTWCTQMIAEAGAIAAPLNYQPPGHTPFPKSICTSVNHVICHGIPNDTKTLRNGDIVNVDITVVLNGYFGDASRMYMVGTPNGSAKSLCEGTVRCLEAGIAAVKPDVEICEIGNAIHVVADNLGYGVVHEYCGHGIGLAFHESPQIVHYRNSTSKQKMIPNMVFTIEPMINAGKRHIKIMPDGWTVVTKDRSLSAQWEHTIRVTETGAEILTVAVAN